MNNTYALSLLCIIVLALAPACCGKRQEKAAVKDDINTMIELDNSVFEIEEATDEEPVVKF